MRLGERRRHVVILIIYKCKVWAFWRVLKRNRVTFSLYYAKQPDIVFRHPPPAAGSHSYSPHIPTFYVRYLRAHYYYWAHLPTLQSFSCPNYSCRLIRTAKICYISADILIKSLRVYVARRMFRISFAFCPALTRADADILSREILHNVFYTIVFKIIFFVHCESSQ